jgi:Uma2 family endonuclease
MEAIVAEVGTGGWPTQVTEEWTVEMLDGTLLVSPSPVPLHQAVIGELHVLLRGVCPPDRFVLLAPLDWRPDGRTSLAPDLLVVRRDRIGPKNIQETPTLVVEVISPSSARIDRMLKFSRYAEGGIEQYWIVDPRVRSNAVYHLVDGEYSLLSSAEGTATISVTTPFTISLTPDQLITI